MAARRDGQIFIFGGREMEEGRKGIEDVVAALNGCGFAVTRVMKDIGMKQEEGEYYSIGICRAAEKSGKKKAPPKEKPAAPKAVKRKGAK
jgi:hypothetical protein